MIQRIFLYHALPGADVRIVQMSSELHRATFGGPGPFGGKFKSIEEFKEDIGPSNLYARTKACVLLFTKVFHFFRSAFSLWLTPRFFVVGHRTASSSPSFSYSRLRYSPRSCSNWPTRSIQTRLRRNRRSHHGRCHSPFHEETRSR